MIAGALTPARIAPPPATTNPRLAARLYAGAVDAVPTTTLDTRPSAPPLSPLPVSGNPSGAASVEGEVNGTSQRLRPEAPLPRAKTPTGFVARWCWRADIARRKCGEPSKP